MRFVAAFEAVLDPVVAVLDTLPAHFDPELAPLDILDLATKWLGLEHNEAQPAAQLRNLVRRTAELGRLRGTHAGVELALKLNFPDLPLRIEDGGSVVWSTDGELPKPSPPSFVVYCDRPISQEEAAEVARVIEAIKPVHVGFRLRIKGTQARGRKLMPRVTAHFGRVRDHRAGARLPVGAGAVMTRPPLRPPTTTTCRPGSSPTPR